jgi:hypothetical protein
VGLLDDDLTVVTLLGLLLIVAGSWLAAEGRPPRRVGISPETSANAPN